MKFKCEKESLMNAVRAASSAVTAVSLPVEQNIRMILEGKKLTVLGSDPSLTIQTLVTVDGEEDGEVCLPSKSILDVVTVLNQHPNVGAVSINDSAEDSALPDPDDEDGGRKSGPTVNITGEAGADFTLRQLPAGNFDALSIDKDASKIKLKTKDFIAALKQVVEMTSKIPSRPVLNGVLIEAEGSGKTKATRLVASDTFRLGIRDLDGADLPDTGSVLVPANSINRLISLTDESEEITLSIEETQVGFEFDDTTVVTQLLSGDFPDYKKLLSTEDANTLEVKKAEIDQALAQVSVMARDDDNQLIKAEIKKDSIELSAADKNKGSASATLKAKYDGEEISIGLNASYLKDVLKSLDDDDMVAKLSGELKPIYIYGKNIENFKCLLMPVRLSS